MSYAPNIHVPGAWRCAKCGFRLQQMNLNAQDGTVTSRDQAGDVCPNDGAPLWRVTWKDYAAEAFDQIQALIDENARLLGLDHEATHLDPLVHRVAALINTELTRRALISED